MEHIQPAPSGATPAAPDSLESLIAMKEQELAETSARAKERLRVVETQLAEARSAVRQLHQEFLEAMGAAAGILSEKEYAIGQMRKLLAKLQQGNEVGNG